VVGSGRGTKGRGRASRAALNAGMADLEERHRREQRRQRTDELRTGLAILASAYRERLLATAQGSRRATAIEAVGHIDRTVKNLEFNPGELLSLQALIVRLSQIG
jgi:DNA polymerase-3 subunit delta'